MVSPLSLHHRIGDLESRRSMAPIHCLLHHRIGDLENSSGRKTAADYWYDFMAKRVQCGRKGSQRVLNEMDAIGNK